jgi:broad specificity phosphatase PhoE
MDAAFPQAPATTHGTVVLVRHGRTDGNKHHYTGWEDLPLNAVGVAQAHAAAGLLDEVAVDAVFASSLTRAAETAAPIAERHHRPIVQRDELREINYGEYQGRLKADKPFSLRKDHAKVPMPGGESLTDLFARVQRFCSDLLPHLRQGRTVAVVGHYWSNRMLAAALDGGTVDDALAGDYKPANGSVYALGVETGQSHRVISRHWLTPCNT